jgi:hypothetical protein
LRTVSLGVPKEKKKKRKENPRLPPKRACTQVRRSYAKAPQRDPLLGHWGSPKLL